MNPEFLPNEIEQLLLGRVQAYFRGEFTLVRLSETMYEKSTIDASKPIRDLIESQGVRSKSGEDISYEGMPDGTEEFQFSSSIILSKSGVVEVLTSHYRPKAKPLKRGDPRLLLMAI
jgi:hypothetical protein